MKINNRNATKYAILLIATGLFFFVGGYLIVLDQNASIFSFWAGASVAAMLLLLLFIASYKKGKSKLTDKEKLNAKKAAASSKNWWIWAGIGLLISTVIRTTTDWDLPTNYESFLFGAFSSAVISVGIAALLDGVWLKAIFLWNNDDPEVRKFWNNEQ